jgi:hypothetical protein
VSASSKAAVDTRAFEAASPSVTRPPQQVSMPSVFRMVTATGDFAMAASTVQSEVSWSFSQVEQEVVWLMM